MKIKIYSTTNCVWCSKAKTLLNERNIEFEEVNLTDTPEEIDILVEKTGARYVPQIFIDDEFIGSYDKLVQWLEKNEL